VFVIVGQGRLPDRQGPFRLSQSLRPLDHLLRWDQAVLSDHNTRITPAAGPGHGQRSQIVAGNTEPTDGVLDEYDWPAPREG
jgi:hypothetical protein